MAARKSPTKSSPRPSADNAVRGTGGELHFSAGGKHPPLTTNQGIPVSDNQNSLRAHDQLDVVDQAATVQFVRFHVSSPWESDINASGCGQPVTATARRAIVNVS